MADDVVVSPASGPGGATVAADDVSGIYFQRVKIALGADGTHNGDVAAGNPMPISGAVTGPVTDVQLRASPVSVSGTVAATGPLTNAQLRATAVETVLTEVSSDAGGRTRVSQSTTLFDGKILNQECTLLWDTKGTGTATFTNNKIDLTVAAGQYLIRQQKFFSPYFSGKSQLVEMTFDAFQRTTNITKRYGYFSSNAVAPYDSDKDGWWVESDGETIALVVSRFGTEVARIDWTDWDGYADLASYDFSKFTVSFVDFLWLGGAVIRLFFKLSTGGFLLAHTFDYAGTAADVFMRSPNQPVRYEIRSTGNGVGSFRAICSQVSTEGSLDERGKNLVVFNATAVTTNVVGTIYALKGVRKVAAERDVFVRLNRISGAITGVTADSGILMLILDPTLSAPLSWATKSRIEEGTATNQTVTANTGRVIAAVPLVSSAVSQDLKRDQLAELWCGIDNTMGNVILAYMPLSTNQAFAGVIELTEF